MMTPVSAATPASAMKPTATATQCAPGPRGRGVAASACKPSSSRPLIGCPGIPVNHRCHRLHRYSHRLEIRLEGPVDPSSRFVLDFFDVDAAIRPLPERLDHHCVNEIG